MDPALAGRTLRVATWMRKRECGLSAELLKMAAAARASLGVLDPSDLDSVDVASETAVQELPDAA